MQTRTKLIAITAALAVSLAAIYAVIIITSYQRVGSLTGSAATVQTVAPTQPVEAPATEPTTPVEQPAASATEQVQSRTAAVEEPAPQPAEPVSPWTQYMNTVHIAEADQPIVLALIFTGYDWNVSGCKCQRQVQGLVSNESRLHYLNLYVTRTYGSWAAAQAQAATGNW